MSIFKKKPQPVEKRFNLGRPGEVLFQNTPEQDAANAAEEAWRDRQVKAMLTPLSVVAVQLAMEGVKAGILHHKAVKEEGRSKLWDDAS
jgi:uncharacterized protein (DUF2236 family)